MATSADARTLNALADANRLRGAPGRPLYSVTIYNGDLRNTAPYSVSSDQLPARPPPAIPRCFPHQAWDWLRRTCSPC